MRIIAILGATASGKSKLSLQAAYDLDAVILSVDSLSVYKEIDIISAKPTEKERRKILHFGIDIVNVDEEFSAYDFIGHFEKAQEYAKQKGKNLIIAGGSGFYLKALIDGLSNTDKISQTSKEKACLEAQDTQKAHKKIKQLDPIYAEKISSNDRYRCEKWFEIFYEFGIPATEFFDKNHKTSPKSDIEIFEIQIDKQELKERIISRTEEMFQKGAIDEAAYLEQKYGRSYKAMNSIGIKEILGYFDALYDKQKAKELIITNTAQLAKRQTTFNKTQFKDIKKISPKHRFL